ncbi:MAG: GrpB family protein [Roseiflexaceae bacterium]
MLGLRRGAVQIVPYTPVWVTLFESERARLQYALGADALDIQHIGSTAVPGLAAKPILDLGIAVAAEVVVAACVPRLAALGYTYHGYRGTDQGHFFDQGSEQHLTHYLHMLLIGDPAWSNYLRFRDYLIAHPVVRDAYMQLKQSLAAQYAENRAAYTAAKASFVQHILAAAAYPNAAK